MSDKVFVIIKIIAYIFTVCSQKVLGLVSYALHRHRYRLVETPQNVVVIGASFAGYEAARVLANTLPTGYRTVIVERNTHFQFSWVLPRFSVIPDYEHRAFIPYGSYLKGAPDGSYLFVRDSVTEVTKDSVRLRSGGEIGYAYLVVATGSQGDMPSHLNAEDKISGIEVLRGLQGNIRKAEDIVVLGGGPAGVEIAADAKEYSLEKNVTPIHSRKLILHNFDTKLHDIAAKLLQELGVKLVLGERLSTDAQGNADLTLHTGEVIPCDFLIKCIGQNAATQCLRHLIPSSLARSGHITVKPTLQVADSAFPNIYAVGDVVELPINRNSRAAMAQATVAAKNVVNAIGGKGQVEYKYSWWQGGINLTLGISRKVLYVQDGHRIAIMHTKSEGFDKMSAGCWKQFGCEAVFGRERA